MQITDVKIRPNSSTTSKILANASVTFDDSFVVHDIKIINGSEGLFIAMPSRRTSDGAFKDVAHPINAETRNTIQNAALDAFSRYSEEEN